MSDKKLTPPIFAKLAYSVDEAATACALTKTGLYEDISAKRLRACKRGRRTIILTGDLEAYLATLPEYGAEAV